jgi:hypothetical protein
MSAPMPTGTPDQPPTWPPSRDAHDHPAPLEDVLILRLDETDFAGGLDGWDLGFWGTDHRWHSATSGGEVIKPPTAWWPLPLMEVADAR